MHRLTPPALLIALMLSAGCADDAQHELAPLPHDTQEDALIVEVEARDRPGLLYLLASNLSEIGIDILYTLVATYGHRAVDTFYIRDYPGYKITDPRRIEAIRRQLIRALGDEAVTVSHEPKSDRPPLEGRAG